MKYTAYLHGREFTLIGEDGEVAYDDFLFEKDDFPSADRVMKMYKYIRVSRWRWNGVTQGYIAEVERDDRPGN